MASSQEAVRVPKKGRKAVLLQGICFFLNTFFYRNTNNITENVDVKEILNRSVPGTLNIADIHFGDRIRDVNQSNVIKLMKDMKTGIFGLIFNYFFRCS